MLNVSIENLWHCWLAFARGKKRSVAIEEFAYYLENNLFALRSDLTRDSYSHGGYRYFITTDSKRRNIAVASVRDRIVHRLLYQYLVPLFDPRFIYDVWSCRKGKGLLGAIERAQDFAHQFPNAFVWRMDIKKFFDSVHHKTLIQLLTARNIDRTALSLCKTVIESYQNKQGFGMPIGNLTSQIFSNIYLNEFDRYAVHTIRPLRYMRYGDDALFITSSRAETEAMRAKASIFASETLSLTINPKNDIIVPIKRGIKFLGVWIYPRGRRLVTRARKRVDMKLSAGNIASYSGLIQHHEPKRRQIELTWKIYERIISNG